MTASQLTDQLVSTVSAHGDRGDSPCDEADHVRGPLRALGGGQLEGHGGRLQPGPHRLARADDARAAPRRAVALLAVLPRRGHRRRHAVAVHRRRAARGAEVLPRDPAGRRGAPLGLLQALHARGRRARRRDDRRDAARDDARADLGAPQDVRPPRGDGAAARRPSRTTGACSPRRSTLYHIIDRGRPGPVRASTRSSARSSELDLLPGFQRGHAQRLARRAAPHRVRRAAARRPLRRGPRGHPGRDHRRVPRGAAVVDVRRGDPGLGPRRTRRSLGYDARGPLRGGRADAGGAPARDRPAARRDHATSRCRSTCRRASAASAASSS